MEWAERKRNIDRWMRGKVVKRDKNDQFRKHKTWYKKDHKNKNGLDGIMKGCKNEETCNSEECEQELGI